MTPPLPKTIADLERWQVHADELMERGDPRGALIAYELSLGDSPSKAELAEFHRQTNRLCRASPWLGAAWLLGHVRTLNVVGNPRRRLMMSRQPPELPLETADVPALKALLESPVCSRLESISFLLDHRSSERDWLAVMRVLPPSCSQVRLTVFDSPDAKHLVDALPAHVTRLACGPRTRWIMTSLINDHVEEVDFRHAMVDLRMARALAERLEAHPRVRVRLGYVRGRDALELLRSRSVLGAEGDAALVHEGSGAIVLLRRRSVEELQRRSGVITVRAQSNRSVPETFGFEVGLHRTIVVTEGDHLVRHGDGRWTARVTAGEGQLSMSIDGIPVGEAVVPLRPDARVELDGQPYRFIEHLSGT